MKYTIGIDLGVSDVGWSVFNNESDMIEKSGVRTFSQSKDAKDRRVCRSTRRRMKRRDNRESDISKVLESIDFPSQKIIDTELIKTRVNALSNKISKQDITNIILFLSSNRGYIPFGNEEVVFADLKGKYPCEYYLDSFLEKGKYRALNDTVKIEDNIRELNDMLINQSKYYKEINEDFINDIIDIIKRKRKFWEGPGSIDNKFTPYGRFKNEEDVLNYNSQKLENPNYEKYIYEDLIGKCKININEKCAVNINYYAQEFNFVNDFTNLFFGNMEDIVNKEYVRLDGEKIKLSRDGILLIKEYILSKNIIKIKSLFMDTIGVSLDNVYGYRINKKGEIELSMFQTYKSIKNMFLKEKQNIDWILDIDVYNKIMDYVNLAPGVVELCKMIENDTSLNKKFNKEELDIIKDIKVKKNKDFQYHALSLSVLKKSINDMLKYEMNFQQVSNKLDYGKEAREFFIKNYTKSDAGLPLIESRFIDDIIASPQVKKSLRQAIKIINAIIKEKQYYPDVIAVESTKEMNGKEVKQMITSEQRVLESIRKEAEKTLTQNFDIDKLTNANIEKVMLYKETNGHCIYCNKAINLNDVVNNSLEVEHILPISKSFDNSYNNKTISCKDCNDKKGNKTPYNYLNSYGLFDEFEKRVLELKMPQYKINNLLLKGDIEKYSKKFINRNLRDTAYATKELINQIKLFNNYLESIRDIKIKTLSTPGQLTHNLRDKYKLNKNRDDGLYHHAVDASIVSAISNSSIGKLIIESQNDSKFWINNKNIENQIEKLQNASLDKSIDSIRIINNDNILVSSQTIKNPQGKLSNANMYKIIKKEDNYYKIDQIDNIYEFDFNKNRAKFEKLLDENDKTITLLCFDKDKKLFKLIKDIYLEFKDSKINPFVDYALEKNNITDVKDFNILKYGIRVNDKPNAPILKTLRYYSVINEPYLVNKDNINKKENTLIAFDSLSQYCTRVYYNKTKNCFAFLPIYSISVDLITKKVNEDNELFRKLYKKYINENQVEFIVDLFNGDYIEIGKKNGKVLEGNFKYFDKTNNAIETKNKNYFSISDKQLTLYSFDVLGKKYKRLTYEIK